MLTGGCFCGAIRYEVLEQASNQTNCHCTLCRGTTGAPCVAWFSVPIKGFTLVRGCPTQFRSSAHATRSFCATCGTQLTFADDSTADEIDVTACSLDEPRHMPPHDHTYTDSRLSWLKLADDIPQFARSRAEG
jgi:hypothetical protein